MTKTDKNGIVFRNCATINKFEEGCEEDVHGAILCYCLTDYCNAAPTTALSTTAATLAATTLAWVTVKFNGGIV